MFFRNRKLRLEPLEDRRVLAAVVVTNNLDTIDGDTSSLTALEAAPGDDGISIREAIEAANNTPGADEITFDFGHDGPEVILLTEGELLITEDLTITGDGPELLAIDAQQQSRVISVDDPSDDAEEFDVELRGFTVRNGRTTGDAVYISPGTYIYVSSGAGIYSLTRGTLSLHDMNVHSNVTTGIGARGGGVLARYGNLELFDSLVMDNSTTGSDAHGGGIYFEGQKLSLVDSVVTRNSTADGRGGGISTHGPGEAELVRTEVSANVTHHGHGGGIYTNVTTLSIVDSPVLRNAAAIDTGRFGNGGGAYVDGGTVSIVRSTFEGNRAMSLGASGGGLYDYQTTLEILDSTFSKNQSDSRGGGIVYFGVVRGALQGTLTASSGGDSTIQGAATLMVSIRRTTIADNEAQGTNAQGGGLFTTVSTRSELEVINSIIAHNHADATGSADVVHLGATPLNVQYSLIGDTTGSGIDENTGTGNLLNVDPHLGPLADHGGPTKTHALLPGSPAIDAGDPSIAYDPMEDDQRGEGFARVADGGGGLRIDIGAYESQGAPDYPVGDYNHDGIAGIADYVLWRNTLGSTANLAADGSGNNIVDAADYTVWREHFGNTTIPLTPVETPTDAAFALLLSPESDSETAAATTAPSTITAEGSADEGLLLLGRDNEAQANRRSLLRMEPVAHDPDDAAAAFTDFDVAWGMG